MAKNRLLSVDVMRGITIAGMILVNNPGSWGHIYTPLEHASWNGLTPTDLVFPFFMFIMGVSTYFSLRKFNFNPSTAVLWKILRRTVLLILIGWAIGWISRFWSGMLNPEKSFWEAVWNFSTMRYMGVFQRLALCYCATALIAVYVDHKRIKWIIGTILAVYAVILLACNGYVFGEENIIRKIDIALLGEDHMYTDMVDDVRLIFDPEGLLSTIPSIAHCLIGFLCGAMIIRVKDNTERSYNLLLLGAFLTFTGFLLAYGCPINKKVWSPTFVLTTCGLASSLLAILIWMIDIKGWKTKGSEFFEAFGINPLYLYVQSSVLSIALSRISIGSGDDKMSVHGYVYRELLVPLCGGDEVLGSCIFAILFVLLNWIVGYILYKKKIYIKI